MSESRERERRNRRRKSVAHEFCYRVCFKMYAAYFQMKRERDEDRR